MDMANGMTDQGQRDILHSSSSSAQQQSKMEVSEHPLPTPPSVPPDTYDRVSSPARQVEDPHSASSVLVPPAAADASTSAIRNQPPSLTTQSSSIQQTKVNIPQAETSIQSDRLHASTAMDIDEKPLTSEMVNGHKEDGVHTSRVTFSGPTFESPEPTNQPTPPIHRSIVTGAEPAPSSLATQPQPPSQSLPTSREPQQIVSSNRPVDTDVTMQDVIAPSKPFRGPPSTSDEPPAKRLKTESSTLGNVTSKKLPANQQKFLMALIRQVKKSKDATPFREPVDPIKLNIPRYFDVIDRPMDISTIERKLTSGAYPSAQTVVDDFNLMIDNCVKFNGLENPVTKMGKNIQATFEKGMKTLPPEQIPQPPKPVAPIIPPSVAAPSKPKSPAPARRPSVGFPPIRRESLTADGRPKREIKPPPERDIPMDKPRLRKKHAAELRFCQNVMKELQKKVHEPYSYPFLAPVDAVALNIPDYYKIIKHPMDLGTVDTKLKEQQYTNADEFYADIKLIFKNCYKYNGPDSPVSALGKQLEKVFDKKWLEKPEEPPEKPSAKRGLSSSPPREDSSSDEDEISRIQEQMTLMAQQLSEMKNRKKQRHDKSPTFKGKGTKGKKPPQRSNSGSGPSSKPKKPKEVIPEVTFEQKRELSEKINFLSPSKMQGVLELIKDAMPLDAAQEEIELDIDILPPKTLHALYMYVVKDTKVPNSSSGGNSKGGSKAAAKPKKKREVLSADAQNRKIAELEGMLDHYDKKRKPQAAESESEDESEDEVSSDDSD